MPVRVAVRTASAGEPMSLGELVEACRALPVASAAAASAYEEARPAMLASVNAELLGREDLPQLLGGSSSQLMTTNHENHAAFMSNVLALGQHELLARSLPWIYRTYRARGFSYGYFLVELQAWRHAIDACLPAEWAGEVSVLYQWMVDHHAEVVSLAEERPEEATASDQAGRWSAVEERYLAALLAGDVASAIALARTVAEPSDLEGFYLSVIQPAMYAVGARWEAGDLSVAQEHLASAITSRVVVSLSAARTARKPSRGRAMVSAAPYEFHELGGWMISDLLEADGWEVIYVGANTPAEALVDLVRDRRPAFVALSVTMPFGLTMVRSIIAAVHAVPASPPVRCLVGGRVFNEQPGLWKELGADGWAKDAHEAVVAARAFGAGEQRG